MTALPTAPTAWAVPPMTAPVVPTTAPPAAKSRVAATPASVIWKFAASVIRGSPLLIQMFMIYYGHGQFQAIRSSIFWVALKHPFECAVLSLALCTGGYTAEIFRSGLIAVPEREVEAARSIGMSGFLLFRRIIAPVALRYALPAYSTELVLMVKSTSLASLVTVWEITGVAQRIMTQTYRTTEVFLCAAAIYLVINFVLVRLLGLLEWRLSGHQRRRPDSLPTAAALEGTPT